MQVRFDRTLWQHAFSLSPTVGGVASSAAAATALGSTATGSTNATASATTVAGAAGGVAPPTA
jgi:hypothetical protein